MILQITQEFNALFLYFFELLSCNIFLYIFFESINSFSTVYTVILDNLDI